jgi:hypothetical protein
MTLLERLHEYDGLASTEARLFVEAARRIEELEARSGWRLIETAPKDDTPVLIYTTNGSIWVATWAYDDQWQPEGMPTMDTTHWMPLPEPPKG